jgi:hypothetical protein
VALPSHTELIHPALVDRWTLVVFDAGMETKDLEVLARAALGPVETEIHQVAASHAGGYLLKYVGVPGWALEGKTRMIGDVGLEVAG